MKNSILLAVFLTFFAVSFSSAQDEELRVLTYNIHIGIGMDQKLDLPRVAEVIKAVKPDLVALQEVDRNADRTQKTDQPKELEELTGMKCIFGKTIDRSNGEYGIAILSKHPVLEHKFTHYPKTQGFEDRGALEAVVEVPLANGEKKKIRFLTTHFCHINKDRRKVQAEKVNELYAKDDMVTIIGGDFNDTLKSDCIKTILEHWTDGTDASPTYPSTRPRLKIDYIFYRPQNALKVKRTEVIDEKIASDHSPVLTVFQWGEKSE